MITATDPPALRKAEQLRADAATLRATFHPATVNGDWARRLADRLDASANDINEIVRYRSTLMLTAAALDLAIRIIEFHAPGHADLGWLQQRYDKAAKALEAQNA